MSMVLLLPDVICYGLPLDAIANISMSYEPVDDGYNVILFWGSDPIYNIGYSKTENSYEFICCSLTATEEDAAKVVKKAENGMYYDYVLFRGHLQNYLDTAVEALTSLLKHHNLDPSLNWGIIKKK